MIVEYNVLILFSDLIGSITRKISIFFLIMFEKIEKSLNIKKIHKSQNTLKEDTLTLEEGMTISEFNNAITLYKCGPVHPFKVLDLKEKR